MKTLRNISLLSRLSLLPHRTLLIASALTMALAMGSCSSEDAPADPDAEYGKPAEVTVKIEAAPMAVTDITGSGVGGTYLPAGSELDNEKIHAWKLFFVDKNNVVRRIVTGGSADRAVRSDSVRTTLHTGVYTVYAIANNIDGSGKIYNAPDFGGLSEGSIWAPGNDPTALIYNTNTNPQNFVTPITGKRKITVTGRVDEVHEIEMIRTHARVDIVFANKSASKVKINGVHFEKAYHMPLHLLFRDPCPSGTPLEPWSAQQSQTDYAAFELWNGTSSTFIKGDEMPSGTEYANGTLARYYLSDNRPYGPIAGENDNPTQTYAVRVFLTREDGSEDVFVVMLDKNYIPFINRNDYIQIPITISDWVVDYDVLFYPPIGGYPAVEQHNEQKECYFVFKSAGKFNIFPKIRRAGANSPYLRPDEYSLTITKTEGTDGLFSQEPAYDANTKEIVGELGTTVTAGYAVYNLRVSLKQVNGQTYTYSRNIVILRQ